MTDTRASVVSLHPPCIEGLESVSGMKNIKGHQRTFLLSQSRSAQFQALSLRQKCAEESSEITMEEQTKNYQHCSFRWLSLLVRSGVMT